MRDHATVHHPRIPLLFVLLAALSLLFGAGASTGTRAYAAEDPDEVLIAQSIILTYDGDEYSASVGYRDGLFVLASDLGMDIDDNLMDELEQSPDLDYEVSDPAYIDIHHEEVFDGFYLWYIRFLKSPDKGQPQWFEFTAGETTYHVDVAGSGKPTWNDLYNTLHDMSDGQILRLPCDIKAWPGNSSILLYAKYGDQITLDLNGHTLDATGIDNGFAIALIGGKSLVIMDSSEDQSGKITGGGDGQAVLQVLSDTLTLESGTISGNKGGGVCARGTYSTNGHSGDTGTFIMNGGTICDNEATGGGGVLVYDGVFEMNGGTITNNTAERGGGGVYLSSGLFAMAGGSIQNNQAGTYGGGLIVSEEAEFAVSGSPVISGNTATNKGNNVYLAGETSISMQEPLTPETVFSVAAELSGRTVTAGLSGNGTLDNFQAEEDGWVFVEDGAGEVMFGKEAWLDIYATTESSEPVSHTMMLQDQEYTLPDPTSIEGITIAEGQVFYGWKMGEEFYDPGETIVLSQASTSIYAVCSNAYWAIRFAAGHENATGRMKAVKVLQGDEYELPTCGFGTPEGHTFAGWKVGEETKAAGERIPVTGDMTVTASWSVNSYTATFDANGGTGEIPSITELYGTEIELPDCAFVPPAGRTFGSWRVEGKNPHYNAHDKFVLTGDTVIQPRWVGLWGDLQHQIDEAEDGKETTITLLADTAAESNDSWLVIPENKIITIDLNGCTLDRHLDKYAMDSVMWVKGKLTIKDSSEAGTGTITGGKDSGVYVDGGSLVLEGGNITGNSGMDGGGIKVEGGDLIMRGGCISQNTGVNGAGISLAGGSFTLTGGTICDNTGIIDDYPDTTSGGGVYLEKADFEMSGGIIKGNDSNVGGGLFLDIVNAVISGGKICDNKATISAGGIYLYGENTLDIAGGEITGNRAESRFGGGIYIDYIGTKYVNTLNVSGGTIGGNYAGRSGGGIGTNRGNVTLSGGKITGNRSGGTHGGLDLSNCTVYLKGSPYVSGNTDANGESNLYYNPSLTYNRSLVITGELTEEALVGVHLARDPKEGEPEVFTSGLPGNGTESAFFSDNTDFCVALNSDGEAALKIAFEVVCDKIDALRPAGEVTTANVEAIADARAAYDALTDAQREKVPAETLAKLEACEQALTSDFVGRLDGIAGITEDNKEDVRALLDVYEKMSDSQRDAVDKQLGRAGTKKLSDLERALVVTDRIDDLKDADEIGADDEMVVAFARMAYELLSKSQKELISEDTVAKLEAAEAKLAEVKAAADAAAQLAAAKSSALDRLQDYSEAKAPVDLTKAERAAYNKAVADGRAAISAAKDKAAVAKALTAAKRAVDSALAKIEADRAADAKARTITTVTVNARTVTAKSVKKAIAKAGGRPEYVKTIVLGKKVRKVKRGAFKKCKRAKTLVVKTKRLKKSTVRGSLKGSKVTKVKVKVAAKEKTNKRYVAKYRKAFTKRNAGRKVKVTQ